jgi:dTMP kinase
MSGKLITFEGLENCGKSTQVKLLEPYLQNRIDKVWFGQEPGGTALGGAMRRLIKEPQDIYAWMNTAYADHKDFSQLPMDQKRTPEAELFMYLTSRADFFGHTVKPKIDDGYVVVLDRSGDSSRAYQGGGWFHSQPPIIHLIKLMNNFAMRGLTPDLTFFLDVPVGAMRKRQDQAEDEIERRKNEFFERARNEFLTIASQEPERVVVVDGMLPIEGVQSVIRNELESRLGL